MRAAVATDVMSALVYQGPGRKSWERRPRPALQAATDAIVRVTTTTICGTDLHILKGDVATVEAGRILGHEGAGVIEEIGGAVGSFAVGDRVLISCITACARCEPCRRGMYSHCRSGGWVLGHRIDGTQAEYVRIPFADTSLYALPPGVDEEQAALLSDIFPTGFECGVLNGRVEPGDTVAIVGAGPIGLATLLTAQLFSPGETILIDLDRNRLDAGLALGATRAILDRDGSAREDVLALTDGLGVDVAVEAVGTPEAFETCQAILAPGGRLANVGVHGRGAVLHLDRLWHHNVTITTRLVDTVTTARLLRAVRARKLAPERLVTHRFELGDMLAAYETFSNAAREKALKVILRSRPD